MGFLLEEVFDNTDMLMTNIHEYYFYLVKELSIFLCEFCYQKTYCPDGKIFHL